MGELDAAGLEADDEAERAIGPVLLPEASHRFERGGGGVVGDRAGAPQARVDQERGPSLGSRHQARLQRSFPSGPDQRLLWKRFAPFERLPEGGDVPARRRNSAQAADKDAAHAHLLRISVAFTPAEAKRVGQGDVQAGVLRVRAPPGRCRRGREFQTRFQAAAIVRAAP